MLPNTIVSLTAYSQMNLGLIMAAQEELKDPFD